MIRLKIDALFETEMQYERKYVTQRGSAKNSEYEWIRDFESILWFMGFIIFLYTHFWNICNNLLFILKVHFKLKYISRNWTNKLSKLHIIKLFSLFSFNCACVLSTLSLPSIGSVKFVSSHNSSCSPYTSLGSGSLFTLL